MAGKLVCWSCRQPLGDRQYHYPGSGRVVGDCCVSLPACTYCGMPANGVTMPDGRICCRVCQKSLVTEVEKARKLFQGVIRDLDNRIGMKFLTHPIMYLCTQNMMPGTQGSLNGTQFGVCVCRGSQIEAYVLTWLPQLIFKRTLAHELSHAWQFNNCSHRIGVGISESFAEWAVETLYGLPPTEICKDANKSLMEKFSMIASQHGCSGVLEWMRQQ